MTNGSGLTQQHSSTINTLSTSQVNNNSRRSALGKTTPNISSTLHQDRSSKRSLAKQLYKELKKILLSGVSLESYRDMSVGTDSVHSFVLDKVCRKVSERSFKQRPNTESTLSDERKMFIKKELKRAVRRMLKSGSTQDFEELHRRDKSKRREQQSRRSNELGRSHKVNDETKRRAYKSHN